MPELQEQMYCSQQIVIPPKYPYILKRYCKAAIKTQPYDLLRWSFEYFKALSEHRPPPVKLRLEYPIYSTEGGLTRGCLKVLANQLSPMKELPLPVVKAAWQGFCLDPEELKRIFCLCEVYRRGDVVQFHHFVAVAAGLLTKCLTHTMILLCESLTKEPDGGSAAIPVEDFLAMYKFLAIVDASKDVRYCDGYREGEGPPPEPEEEEEILSEHIPSSDTDSEGYWEGNEGVQKVGLIGASIGKSTKISAKNSLPILGKIERSPSIEIAGKIEWENFQMERKGKPFADPEIDKKLREISNAKLASRIQLTDEMEGAKEAVIEKEVDKVEKDGGVNIYVRDENDIEIPYEFYGEPEKPKAEIDIEVSEDNVESATEELEVKEEVKEVTEKEKVQAYVDEIAQNRKRVLKDMEQTFDDINETVTKVKTVSYDLGMVAGRMMSTTSGEFIVAQIEKDIMDYIDEQIAILPDPDLKKKKAKPEEVKMIQEYLEEWLDENLQYIIPDIEEVEEEELPIPDIVQVYAVPGIGPPVDLDTITEFEDYALDVCKVQADVIMPRNIRHYLCPPLEKYEEINYEAGGRGEEVPVPTGGTIIQ